MIVIGIMANPAKTRAAEPVSKFVTVDGFVDVELWTVLRKMLRVAKYSPLPTPVRIAEGIEPRHSAAIGFGPERIVRIVGINLASCDCWTRVLSKSAGCKTIAETIPPASPDEKCLRLLVRVKVLTAVEVAGPLELASRRDEDAGISLA